MTEKVEVVDIDLSDIIDDGAKAQRTLKDLKDEVKNLRTQLDNCTIGSEEFTSTLEELTEAQSELKNATKSSNETLEGSYDSLVQKMGELKKAWRATADEAERTDLGEQISSINQQLKDMDAEIGNYQRNVGNYGSAFDDVTIKIEGGVARFERFNNATRSVIGSLDLVEGGLKAIGVENEKVNNLMDKMQGAMKMTAGLDSIKEGIQTVNQIRIATQGWTTAQIGLNTAMNANPLGVILLTITAAVTAVAALASALNNAKDSAASLKEQNEKLTETIDEQNYSLDLNIRLMKAKGATELEALRAEYKGKKEIADKAYQEYRKMQDEAAGSERWFGLGRSISKKEQAELDAAYQKYLELHKDYARAVDNYNVGVAAANTKRKEEQVKAEQEATKAAEAAAKATRDAWVQAANEVNKSYQEQKKDREEYWMTDLEVRLRRLDEQAKKENEILLRQLENRMITEEEYNEQFRELNRIHRAKQLEIVNQYNEAEKQKLEEKRQGYIDLQKSITMSQMTESEQQLQIIKDQYDQEKKMLDDLLAAKIISQEEYVEAVNGIESKRKNSEADINKQLAEQSEKYGALGFKIQETGALSEESQKKIATGINLVGNAFGQTGQLLTTLANTQDKESKKGFENYKNLSIAAAVMSMLQGIISSWTSAMSLPAPLSFITGGIMSAFTATLGGIQIDQIKKQTFGGGSSGGSAAKVPSVDTAALLGTPINYTTEVKGAMAEEDIAQRVYVVESDISNTQKRVNVAEEESVY